MHSNTFFAHLSFYYYYNIMQQIFDRIWNPLKGTDVSKNFAGCVYNLFKISR